MTAGLTPGASVELSDSDSGSGPADPTAALGVVRCRCRTATSDGTRRAHHRRMSYELVRPRNRVIAGVCSGLADRYGLRASTVRLIFVLSCLLPGPQILVYAALWIVMPDASRR